MDARKLEFIEIGEEEVMRRVRRKRRSTQAERLRRRKRRRRARIIRNIMFLMMLTAASGLVFGVVKLALLFQDRWDEKESVQTIAEMESGIMQKRDSRKWADFYAAQLARPELTVDLLTPNEYSRPGDLLPEVKNIFIHYTANAGTTAEQNRSYFESLGETGERSASAHFVIGIDGKIVQCIPTKEIAYAVMKRNYDSISIECCYADESGKFSEETYRSLIEMTAWLLHKYELEPEDVLRHYDEGGKNCPKYYVENEDAWQRLLSDLAAYMTEVSEK